MLRSSSNPFLIRVLEVRILACDASQVERHTGQDDNYCRGLFSYRPRQTTTMHKHDDDDDDDTQHTKFRSMRFSAWPALSSSPLFN